MVTIESWNATEMQLRTQLQEKDSQLQVQTARIIKSIKKMYSKGISIEEIAEDFELEIQFVKDALK
ncbi:MAG: hypothetical protein IJ150_12130 [Bacteroidales bacterium]|nr:hypothetical protein [Bacteroidales bacterium]